MFSTKTSRDVEMVPSVSKEHMCLHGKINWQKNFRNKEGHHPYISTCFCGKRFYFPCFFTFYGVKAALWQFEPEALEESNASHMQPCTESKDSGSS